MRPQGRAHAGFYPLPPGAVQTALMYLYAENPEGVMPIDPCVGNGAAFKGLLEGLGVPLTNACAVELTENRGAEAEAALPGCQVVYPADFLEGVNRPPRSFSFAYVNPPYDDEIGGGGRVETQFLEKMAHMLRIDGIILMVVPEDTWEWDRPFKSAMARWFVDIQMVKPEEADRPYNEVLVFGVRKDNTELDWVGNPVMQFKADCDEPYVIPTLKHRCPTFRKVSMTHAELRKCLINSPIEHIVDVPNPIERGRPPLALGEGHNGLLVSSGQAPPIVAVRDGKGRLLEIPHLVRGVSKKIQVLKDSEEGETPSGESFTKDIYTEIFVLIMKVLLHTGEIITLEQGSEELAQQRDQQKSEVRTTQEREEEAQRKNGHAVLPHQSTKRASHGGIAV